MTYLAPLSGGTTAWPTPPGLCGSTVVETAPTETNMLSRLESIGTETGPRLYIPKKNKTEKIFCIIIKFYFATQQGLVIIVFMLLLCVLF